MKTQTSLYISASSPVHACDPRVKIVLLFAFTLCVFFVDTWAGLGVFAVLALAVMAASQVPLGRYFGVLAPVYTIMAFTVVFNLFAGTDALMTLGPLAITGSGLSRGCFFALRILLLCLGSMIVCFTSTSTALTGALGQMLRPLEKLHLPVDDMTTVFSIALRFIPLLAREVERTRDAQWSRGGRFDGSITERIRAWGKVFFSVFVRLFRQADHLSAAMDARCYGLPGVKRTAADTSALTGFSAGALLVGLAMFVVCAIFL